MDEDITRDARAERQSFLSQATLDSKRSNPISNLTAAEFPPCDALRVILIGSRWHTPSNWGELSCVCPTSSTLAAFGSCNLPIRTVPCVRAVIGLPAELRGRIEKQVLGMRTRALQLIAGLFSAMLLAAVSQGTGAASADPVPANECGAHTEALDCMTDTSPPTGTEQSFVNSVGPHFPNVPSAWLVQYARGTCGMLRGGASTGLVVSLLANRIGASKQAADQVMDAAMAADCPNLTVGTDGVAR